MPDDLMPVVESEVGAWWRCPQCDMTTDEVLWPLSPLSDAGPWCPDCEPRVEMEAT